MDRRRKQYTTAHLILDLFLICITGGFWLLWIIVRYLRSNTR